MPDTSLVRILESILKALELLDDRISALEDESKRDWRVEEGH